MMITIERYNEGLAKEWDDFIENKARNATFLHSRKFFRHNPLNQEFDASLIFVKNSNIIAVSPAVWCYVEGHKVWNSHAYCTYGGFVVSPKVGVEEALEMVGQTVEFARENGADELIVRNPFRIFNAVPSDETDYAMWYHKFQVFHREVEVALPLAGFTEQTVDQLYDGKTRNAVRKAERENITVSVSNDFARFWQILEQNLADKHEAKPTHTIEQINTLREMVGDEKVKLFAAYLNKIMIAGVVVFVANQKALHAQYIAGLQEYQSLRPINLLIHKICLWGIEHNHQYFNLGMSTSRDGHDLNYGLCKFKEGFGGRSVLRETMRRILS